MLLLSTRTHGVLDYLMGLLLIVSPWLFNFAYGGLAQQIPVILGMVVLLMAVFTNYEVGLLKILSMRAHLALDVLAGIFLAVSPWLFSFAERIYLPHLLLGLFEAVAALLTRRGNVQTLTSAR